MQKNKKRRSPLPKSFDTIDKFVEFWDMHSTADYPKAFREIKGKLSLQRRKYFRVSLALPVGERLAERARAQGLTLDALVNQMLEKQLGQSA